MKSDMLMMMLMMQQGQSGNNGMASMLPLLMMSGGADEKMDEMLPLLMMSQGQQMDPLMLMALMGDDKSDMSELLLGDPCAMEISILHKLGLQKPKLKALLPKLYAQSLAKHGKLNPTTQKYLVHSRIDLIKNYLTLGIEGEVTPIENVDEV
jgi:hypothetical protein